MTIRRAEKRDVPEILELLSQVLEIHAAIRPDLFVSGTTKYCAAELEAILADEKTPVYVAEDGADGAIGYAFCVIKDGSDHMKTKRTLYIDDLCVDGARRKGGVGEAIFRFVCTEARRLGCGEITLNVWEGNDAARAFYDKMGMKPRSTTMELTL